MNEYFEHEVVKGDNPWKLSMKYFGNPSMVDEIMDINNIADPTKIQIGTVLKIPGKSNEPNQDGKKEVVVDKHAPIKPMPQEVVLEKRDLRKMAEKIADQVGIPSDLFLGLVTVESGWNPKAKSSVGATGLTQLMPGTASEMGVENPEDPASNLLGGAKYLKRMIKAFDKYEDSEVLGLMAYHAGAGNIKKWIDSGKPSGGSGNVGKYTLSYPQKVFAAAGR